MLTNNINFKNFTQKQQSKKIVKLFKELIQEDNEILNSLKKTYKNSYSKKDINKLRKFSNYILIGMGGSILGTKAIYSFLKDKIKKKILI